MRAHRNRTKINRANKRMADVDRANKVEFVENWIRDLIADPYVAPRRVEEIRAFYRSPDGGRLLHP